MTHPATAATGSTLAAVAAAVPGAERPLAAVLGATPAPPGAEEARRLVEEELRDPRYVRSWWGLFLQWVQSLLAVPVGRTDLAPLLGPVLIGLGVVLVAVIAWAVLRRRRRHGDGPTTPPVFTAGEILDAEEHRRRARTHLESRQWSAAAIEAFRALTAAGLARGEVRDAPDLTAHEAGRALAQRYPAHAEDLRRADRTFAAVRYGDAAATEEEARRLLDLDAALEAVATAAAESSGEGAPGGSGRRGASAPPALPTAYASATRTPASRGGSGRGTGAST